MAIIQDGYWIQMQGSKLLLMCPRLISICLVTSPGFTYLLLSFHFSALDASFGSWDID